MNQQKKINKMPVVLVINYNEDNKSPDNNMVNNIISELTSQNPDIFILTTQDSRSGTSSHIQHSIKERILNTQKTLKQSIASKFSGLFKKDYTELSPTDDKLKKYKLFSKIDATRESNVKKSILNPKKLCNVRTRVWINTDTVFNESSNNFIQQSFNKKNNSKNYKKMI